MLECQFVDELKISHAFVERMLDCLREHDQQCRDPLVAAQYLSALCALLVAKNTPSEVEARSLLQQLYAFMEQVCGAESTSPEPSGEAFGMWYPSGDDGA